MKITVFGSTGNIGQQVLQQAAQMGDQVTAFTRDPGKIANPPAKLKLIKGDVLDFEAVANAVKGVDAVVCALGMPLMNGEGLRARGTANIVRAMEQNGVKRLVCLSALGAGESRRILPFHYRVAIIPLIMGRLMADHGRQEAIVTNSSLDWVIVRPANFIRGNPTGSYRHGFTRADRSLKLKICHGDVAQFMLRQLGSDGYLHQTPAISN